MINLPELDELHFDDIVKGILEKIPEKKDWIGTETVKRAEEHSKFENTYDKLCWLLAEADLNLRNLYALKILKKLSNATTTMPNETNVRLLSEIISGYHNSLPELEWQLAERRILIELLS
jgi:hypothetical protein